MAWTDDNIQRCLSWWQEGRSASWIAGELNRVHNTGVTRSAVLGQVYRRLGATGRRSVTAKTGRGGRYVFSPRVPAESKLVRPAGAEHADSHDEAQGLAPTIHPEPHLLIDLIDLEPHSCRWPYDDGSEIRFCGRRKIFGSSYCAEHFEASLSPESRRRRAAVRKASVSVPVL